MVLEPSSTSLWAPSPSLHGCTKCDRCNTPSCPICHPREHQHTGFPRAVPEETPDEYSRRGHKHDWQELKNYIVCRDCSEKLKK